MYKFFCFGFILITLLACVRSKNSNINRNELEKLYAEELKKQDRAKYGSDLTNIRIIDNPAEVKRISDSIKIFINHKIAQDAIAATQIPLTEKFIKGDSTVIPEIIKILKGKDKSKRDDIYNGLTRYYGEEFENISIKNPELAGLLFKKLNDKEDASQAINVIGKFKLTGYIEIFEKKLTDIALEHKKQVLFYLATDGKSKMALNYLIERLKSGNINDEELSNYYLDLQFFGQSGDADIKKTVGNTAFLLYTKRSIPQKYFDELSNDSYSSGNPAEALMNCLFDYGDVKAIPVMKEYFNKDLWAENALGGLIRLEGNKHRQLVYSMLENPDKFHQGLFPAVDLFKITKDKSICDKVLTELNKMPQMEDYMINRVVETLVKMDPEYLNKYNKNGISKDLENKLDKVYQLTKLKNKDILEDMASIGIINDKQKQTLQKTLSNAEAKGDVIEMLNKTGLYLFFDTETDEVPVDYDNLIKDFIKISNGKLNHVMVWMHANELKDYKYKYRIYVLTPGKIYIADPEDIGDWYDVNLILNLMNKILTDEKIEERFVFMDTGDQNAQILFGKEAGIKLLREKYGL